LLIYVVAMMYAGIRLIYMITRASPSISRNQLVRGYDDPTERYFDPFAHDFFFLFRAEYYKPDGKSYEMTPDLGSFVF
jgi:hypothetical protein